LGAARFQVHALGVLGSCEARRSSDVANDSEEECEETLSTLITYKVVEDRDGKLEAAARMACNFWNHYVEPETSIVIQVDLFWSPFRYLARSYEPELTGAVIYGGIRFNSVYVRKYTEMQLAITMVHELGHTLGFGWEKWMGLFDSTTGRFTEAAIKRLPSLADMHVETDGGGATQYMHWDEKKHGSELMTGFENKAEYVLPVTIDITELLGHKPVRRLQAKTPIKALLTQLQDKPFTRKEEAKQLATVEFKPHRILERIFEFLPGTTPRQPPAPPKAGRPHKGKRS
jgi:hypothetical protein